MTRRTDDSILYIRTIDSLEAMEIHTKEKILWEALDLFSQQGVAAVSMRQLAKAVGIRESSLYNHFASKQDIFDSLVEACWEKAQGYFAQQGLPFSYKEDLSVFSQRDLTRLGDTVSQVFRYFFEDPWNQRFRKLLLNSQQADPRVKALYRSLYRDYPLQVQEAVFSGLMEAGLFPQGDPAAMALGFYGGVFLLLHTCDTWQEAEPQFLAHFRQFARQQGLEGTQVQEGSL